MKKAIKLIALSLVLVMAVMALASCAAPNADPDKAESSLKNNDYYVDRKDGKISTTIVSGILGATVDCIISATKVDKENESFEALTILYFETADDANSVWEKAQEYANDQKNKDVEESNWVVEKSGKMIWFGTKNAVKAAA